jgi:hypothetical protein
MLTAHVSRTEEKGAIALGRAADATMDDPPESERSGVKSTCALGLSRLSAPEQLPSEPPPADETTRTRLIADLTRLVQEPTMPEGMRIASLTLIGWLARRRREESPHAIGIEEARESERRLRAGRGKVR